MTSIKKKKKKKKKKKDFFFLLLPQLHPEGNERYNRINLETFIIRWVWKQLMESHKQFWNIKKFGEESLKKKKKKNYIS